MRSATESENVKNFTAERRKGPDLWAQMINWFAAVCWSLLVAILIIVGIAKPTQETMFDRMANISIESSWNEELLLIIFYLMVCGFFLSLAGIFLNSQRHKRRTDHYRGSLIFIACLSLVGIVYYLFR